MAAREDQPQPLVGNLLVIRSQHAQRPDLFGQRLLDGPHAPASEAIDRPIAGRSDDPRPRVVGHSPLRPSTKRLLKGLLDSFFSQVEAAGHADQGRDRPARLAAEQEVDVPDCLGRRLSPAADPGTPGAVAARSCRTLRRDSGFQLRSLRRRWRGRASSSRRAALSSPRMGRQ
jgi:hypothetical protein